MIDRLLNALIESENEAADDLLLGALKLGNEQEQGMALGALLQRETVRGLSGVVAGYAPLPDTLKLEVLNRIKLFHPALRECGRSEDGARRLAAMKLIAHGRQGKLAYVLSENLHHVDDTTSQAAVESMVALARWISTETRNLQKGLARTGAEALRIYTDVIEARSDIEQAVARAMDVHRGKHGQELLRAALLLCDWPGSKTLAILSSGKHGGQSPIVRRLQQPPASEHVEAFLLGASHGQLRSHFGNTFGHIDEAPVLDALLRKTHWLKDQQLQLCLHQVTRGTWWSDAEMLRDIDRRPPADASLVAEWLAVSGLHDVMQDDKIEKIREAAKDDVSARLRLLRLAMNRRRGASVQLIRSMLNDPDERLMRMAAREIIRRRPADFENMLLQLMTSAPESVRKVISRAIGHVGFENFWQRFERMDRATRRQAGRAMLKLSPDAMNRMAGRLAHGPIEQRIKALQIAQELGMAEALKPILLTLCSHPNARVRSKAVSVVGDVPGMTPDTLLESVLNDGDGRVRANAIEVLESREPRDFVPMLAQRARSSHNRERANAIKAMHRMKVQTASTALSAMLVDERSEHRISALWTLKQIGWWQLINQVGQMAKADPNLRVRRYALAVLKGVAEMVQERKRIGA